MDVAIVCSLHVVKDFYISALNELREFYGFESYIKNIIVVDHHMSIPPQTSIVIVACSQQMRKATCMHALSNMMHVLTEPLFPSDYTVVLNFARGVKKLIKIVETRIFCPSVSHLLEKWGYANDCYIGINSSYSFSTFYDQIYQELQLVVRMLGDIYIPSSIKVSTLSQRTNRLNNAGNVMIKIECNRNIIVNLLCIKSRNEKFDYRIDIVSSTGRVFMDNTFDEHFHTYNYSNRFNCAIVVCLSNFLGCVIHGVFNYEHNIIDKTNYLMRSVEQNLGW